ncbi:MAG TPA: hypothetical protein VFV38_05220 [Ktedonobacteraceae bacterium]|nr:hypothetical protein [Ktedonobacteraceae bacterium]
MATKNFDALTRALASSTSRRQTLKALVAGAGGLLGLGSLGTALAACFPIGTHCKDNFECCTNTCGPNGKCTCRAKGISCTPYMHECCPGLKCSKNTYRCVTA